MLMNKKEMFSCDIFHQLPLCVHTAGCDLFTNVSQCQGIMRLIMAENLVAPNYDKLTPEMNKYSNGCQRIQHNRASEGSARMTKWQEVFFKIFS